MNRLHLTAITLSLSALSASANEQRLHPVVTNPNFAVELPAPPPSTSFHNVEWSTNLVDGEPVARDYGFDSESTFPNPLRLQGLEPGPP
jgi:hypothetical protein